LKFNGVGPPASYFERKGNDSNQGEAKMLTKTKIALAAAIILGGTASAALARNSYGGPHQTWCDINPACNG